MIAAAPPVRPMPLEARLVAYARMVAFVVGLLALLPNVSEGALTSVST